eukprot:Opistho-1_new@13757
MPNSNFETPEELSLETTLPDIKTLEIIDIQHGFESNQGYIKVITNQSVPTEFLQNMYAIEADGGTKQQEAVEEAVIEYDSTGNPIEKKKKKKKKKKYSALI